MNLILFCASIAALLGGSERVSQRPLRISLPLPHRRLIVYLLGRSISAAVRYGAAKFNTTKIILQSGLRQGREVPAPSKLNGRYSSYQLSHSESGCACDIS